MFKVGDAVRIKLRGVTRGLSAECHRKIKDVDGKIVSIRKAGVRQYLVKFDRPIPSWYRVKGLLDVPMSEDQTTTTSALWIDEVELEHGTKENTEGRDRVQPRRRG